MPIYSNENITKITKLSHRISPPSPKSYENIYAKYMAYTVIHAFLEICYLLIPVGSVTRQGSTRRAACRPVPEPPTLVEALARTLKLQWQRGPGDIQGYILEKDDEDKGKYPSCLLFPFRAVYL